MLNYPGSDQSWDEGALAPNGPAIKVSLCCGVDRSSDREIQSLIQYLSELERSGA
jgi:hypothetical protein